MSYIGVYLVGILEGTCTPQGVWHKLIFGYIFVPKASFQKPIKERVENYFPKHPILGPYILCTRLHGFNSKTKNVLMFSIWFYNLFNLI